MSEAVHGLSCPRCGGIVPVPEGQVIVACPYCEQRSVVSASAAGNAGGSGGAAAGSSGSVASSSLGVRRYQAPLKVEREQAVQALKSFLSGKIQVARDAAREAKVHEVFLVHLTFWAVWGRGVAYAFGQV